ncbi:MAG: Bug family tripartite tricarboxylate transporter substrate binding protein [Lautropia sp.]
MSTLRLLLSALVIVASLYGAPAAHAAYPEKPIQFIVPYAPGSNADMFSRRLAERLARSLGQPIIIENRPGANAALGLDRVAKAVPDGYTWGIGSPSNTFAGHLLMKSMSYDWQRDLTPVAGLYQIPTALLVAADSAYTSFAQLAAYAKANPHKVSYGYGQSTAQMAGANWQRVGDVQLIGVAYKGTPQAVIDLAGGQITVAFAELSVALPQIASGKARALAIVAPQRSSLLPAVPTFAEVQPNALSLVGFAGLMMPANTPGGVVDKVASSIREVVANPEFTEFLKSIGSEPLVFSTSAEFGEYLRKQGPVWKDAMEAAGIKPE